MSEHVDAAPDVDAWRPRWRAAAESTFSALIADPAAYARALATIGEIAADLRRRNADLGDLARAMAQPDDVRAVTTTAPPPPGVPMALLVGVACSMRERDLIANRVRDERRRAIEEAQTAGRVWAVLNGPGAVEDLTGGPTGSAGCVHLHLASGTELHAAIDAWSPEPYRVDVVAPALGTAHGAEFAQRERWIAEVHRLREEIESS